MRKDSENGFCREFYCRKKNRFHHLSSPPQFENRLVRFILDGVFMENKYRNIQSLDLSGIERSRRIQICFTNTYIVSRDPITRSIEVQGTKYSVFYYIITCARLRKENTTSLRVRVISNRTSISCGDRFMDFCGRTAKMTNNSFKKPRRS